MKQTILSSLSAECPWRDTLHWFDTVDSTNDRLKELAANGAPHGTVLIAGQQTKGRGRMGHSFYSPGEKGIYLSVLLRPGCSPEQLMHLTCAAAVAACDAIEAACGYRPGIKWINDLVANNKKVGGILTELSVDSKTGTVTSAIIGIGINCTHNREDFPPDLQGIAASLESVTGKSVRPDLLAAHLITALQKMDSALFTEKKRTMNRYRQNCVTLGREITVLCADSLRCGSAMDIDENGGLVVHFQNGCIETVSSGEVSVRGLQDYSW